jgi:hypothetical protein
MDRRAFVVNAFTTLAIGERLLADAHQTGPEVSAYGADVPPGGTLWGLVVFTSAEPVEMTISTGKSGRTIRGQFDAQRSSEYSWRNTSDRPERVAVRAKALSTNRELPASKVEFISEQNVYVGFGHRATPDQVVDRHGGYPYEAVFIGFIVFDDVKPG